MNLRLDIDNKVPIDAASCACIKFIWRLNLILVIVQPTFTTPVFEQACP